MEQRGLQLENAEADERFWTSLQDMNQSTVEEHKALAATVEHAIASGQADAAGLGKRFTSEDAIKILRANGFSPSDIRQMQHVAEISRLGAGNVLALSDARDALFRNRCLGGTGQTW